MKKLKNFAKNFWADESGQGTAEYVLLIAIVVGVLVVFGPEIKKAVMQKLADTTGKMGSIGE